MQSRSNDWPVKIPNRTAYWDVQTLKTHGLHHIYKMALFKDTGNNEIMITNFISVLQILGFALC
jgi:hypothetical protein